MSDGMFGNIFDVRRQQSQDLQESAMDYARLPRGRAQVAAAARAGGMIGRGITGALGMQTPEEARANKAQQIAAKYRNEDKNNPELYKKMAADFASNSLWDLAEEASNLYDQFTSYNTMGSLAKRMEEAKRYVPECKDDPDSQACIDAASKFSITQKRNTIVETGFGKQFGKTTAERVTGKSYDDAEAAYKSLNVIENANDLLEQGIYNATAANLRKEFAKFLNTVGLTNNPSVGATDAFLANQGSLVGQIIRQFGAGTGLSDADREFAQKMAAGSITLDEDSIRRILDIQRRINEDIIKMHNAKVDLLPPDTLQTTGIDPTMYRLNIPSIRIKQKIPESAKPVYITLPNGQEIKGFKAPDGRYFTEDGYRIRESDYEK